MKNFKGSTLIKIIFGVAAALTALVACSSCDTVGSGCYDSTAKISSVYCDSSRPIESTSVLKYTSGKTTTSNIFSTTTTSLTTTEENTTEEVIITTINDSNEEISEDEIIMEEEETSISAEISNEEPFIEEEKKTETEYLASSISYTKELVISNFRGSYYPVGPAYGGSGRWLVDCSYGDGTGVKGSIASSNLYYKYGYNRDGRTTVYLDLYAPYEFMSGYYYLDDCCADYLYDTIDFYYTYASNCPFQNAGIIHGDCYIVVED